MEYMKQACLTDTLIPGCFSYPAHRLHAVSLSSVSPPLSVRLPGDETGWAHTTIAVCTPQSEKKKKKLSRDLGPGVQLLPNSGRETIHPPTPMALAPKLGPRDPKAVPEMRGENFTALSVTDFNHRLYWFHNSFIFTFVKAVV